MNKICNVCKVEKELTHFGINRQVKDGFNLACKDCLQKKARAKRKDRNPNLKDYGPLQEERLSKYSERICWCAKCKSWKSIDSFHKNRCRRFGVDNNCKVCNNSDIQRKARAFTYQKSYHISIIGKYGQYKHAAKERNYEFSISLEQFKEHFWQKPCYYCGDPIETVGIDRKLNNLGYTMENCVPCCFPCNVKWKSIKNEPEFLAHIKKIAIHCLHMKE